MRLARESRVGWGARFLLAVAIAACVATVSPATPALGVLDDETIPGKPLTSMAVDTFGPARRNVVHRVYLLPFQQVRFTLIGDPEPDCDLFLYPTYATDFTTPSIAQSTTLGTSNETLTYSPMFAGWYYLCVESQTPSTGECMIDIDTSFPVPLLPTNPIRVWGRDRYETAVAIASHNFPDWRNVSHVIIASGEDRAAADPLSASGLAWAYGAPIFLVKSDSTPDCVIEALQHIREQNGPFYLHIVGGPVSVGRGATDDIEANVLNVIYDRIEPYGDRYTLAASIARRMAQERPLDQFLRAAGWGSALIANGEDPDKFFDALALSPPCVTTGWPILLVRKDSIPGPTAQVLSDLGLQVRYIGGGPATVSDAVEAQLEAGANTCERFYGRDRYETAKEISTAFWAGGVTDAANTGVAAKLPDALTGGAFLGLRRGSILLTRTSSLPDTSAGFLTNLTTMISRPYVFGGPNSVDADALQQIDDALDP